MLYKNESIEEYLLNKEVFCTVDIVDNDCNSIITAYSTVFVLKVEEDEISENLQCLGLVFRDFTGQEKEVKLYISDTYQEARTFMGKRFFPVKRLYSTLGQHDLLAKQHANLKPV